MRKNNFFTNACAALPRRSFFAQRNAAISESRLPCVSVALRQHRTVLGSPVQGSHRGNAERFSAPLCKGSWRAFGATEGLYPRRGIASTQILVYSITSKRKFVMKFSHRRIFSPFHIDLACAMPNMENIANRYNNKHKHKHSKKGKKESKKVESHFLPLFHRNFQLFNNLSTKLSTSAEFSTKKGSFLS